MNILVYLKEVPPKEEQVKYQTAEGISDSDKNVLKEALNLRDQEGGIVTAMVIGPPEAEKTAREALTWGADRAVLVLKKETGEISHSAKLLAGAIEAEDMFDIILCGRQAIDGDAAHMAAMTAFFLKIPLIAYSKKMKVSDKKIFNWCMALEGTERTESSLPALVLSVREDNALRHPNVADIMSAYAESTVIPVLKGEQGKTKKIIKPVREYIPDEAPKNRQMLTGRDEQELAEKLWQLIKEKEVV